MPINVKIIHAKDFIRTTVTGTLDFETSKQSLLDIAFQIHEPGAYEILIDLRDTQPTLSTMALYDLGKVIAGHENLARSKIALVVGPSSGEEARFLETVAQNRGVSIQVFFELEKAVMWLVLPKEELA